MTTPDVEPTVAIVVLVLVQLPQDAESASVSVAPTHSFVEPIMGGIVHL